MHAIDERRGDFIHMLGFAPIRSRKNFSLSLLPQLREQRSEMRKNWRRIQRHAAMIRGRARQHEPFARAGAGDVAKVTFVRETLARADAERLFVRSKNFVELSPLGFREDWRARR